jgi:tetratricopeptide (TPR) repeat protein
MFKRLVVVACLGLAPVAWADAKIAVKADVSAKAQTDASAGDAAYAAGNFEAALAAYGAGFAKTRDAAFVYAMAQCHKALGHKDDAKQMFKMYLGAKGTLKYKTDAEAEIKTNAVAGVVGKVKDTVEDIGGGVYGAVKIGIAGSLGAAAKVDAEAADKAYAAGKFDDAAKSYAAAYTKSQESVALYAEAQAHAQAGRAIEARSLLHGYLAANPSGTYAKDAQTLLLALGSSASATVKVKVAAKVSADAKAQAEAADKAFATGKYIDAAKSYADAYAKKKDAAVLYAQGMAQLYAGMTADATTTLKAYLALGGNLEFKTNAEAALRVGGAA